jgi:hypothetical protein
MSDQWPQAPADPVAKAIWDRLRSFSLDVGVSELHFPGLDSRQRRVLHDLAYLFTLHSETLVDEQGGKVVVVLKSPPKEKVTDEVDSDRKLEQIIQDFVKTPSQSDMILRGLSRSERKKAHDIAENLFLDHTSFGSGAVRSIRLKKLDPKVIESRKLEAALMKRALESFQESKDKDAVESEELGQIDDVKLDVSLETGVESIRYVNWNIEWMDHLFASDSEIAKSYENIPDCLDQCIRISRVIKELDADIIAIEEGPANIRRMQLFCDRFLDGEYLVFGGLEEGEGISSNQQLFFIVRKSSNIKNPEIFEPLDQEMRKSWEFDVDGDCHLESYKFTRRPLALRGAVTLSDGTTRPIYFLCIHTKSKYVGDGKHLWNSKNAEDRHKFIVKSVKNRRRIAGECLRIRKLLDKVIFSSEPNPLLIVSGDMNDGPGMDFFEELYLLSDCVDVLLGSPFHQKKLLHSLIVRTKWIPLKDQWTIEFDDFVDNVKGRRQLLDHIFVSQSLLKRIVRASVAHVEFNHNVEEVDSMLFRPSDHRPVYADIAI